MIKRLLTALGLILVTYGFVFSQQGALKGKIFDKSSKEPLAFASIVIESGGKQYGGTQSDENGNYTIKPIPAGKYDIKATYMGYHPFSISGVIVVTDGIRFLDVEMVSLNIELKEVEIIWKPPLIDKGNVSDNTTMTADEIEKLPSRSANGAAIMVSGVSTDENGNMGGIRGQRSDGTAMYIDGIRVSGIGGLPQSSLDQVTVITGGIPAQYGDVTGGVISVITKGPSRRFGGGLQYETSELLDHRHANTLGFSFNGPLIVGKDKSKATSLLGYFVAGELSSSMVGETALTEYTVKDDIKSKLELNPIRLSTFGSGTMVTLNSDYLTTDDLVKVKDKSNSLGRSANILAKIDVRTTNNTNLTFGGTFNYSNGLGYSRTNSLLNSDNNAQGVGYTYRIFGRFTQIFPTDKDNKSSIKNVYYSIQADYSASQSVSQDATHKDDLFKYGYIGKFTTYRKKSYEYGLDTASKLTGYIHNGFADTLLDFQQANFNRTTGNYTAEYYRLFPKNSGYYRNMTILQQFQGVLLNGDEPPSVYGLWSNTGTRVSGYSKASSNQIGINATGSADINNHGIQFGLIYQQNSYSYYSYAAYGLWSLMRQITDKHILQLDKSNPHPLYDAYGVYQDTINYDRLYSKDEQASFDYNLRNHIIGANGRLATNGTDYIDIDSYDMNNHTIVYYDKNEKMHVGTMDQNLSVNWFSADDLLNSGNSYVGYSGYDYTGKKLTSKPSFDDFFTKKDALGNFTRQIAPFQPIYTAGYIQDKFAFNDLLFNVGLRIDRIDLNQKVLKDPYLFYNAKTVGDLKNQNNSLESQIPSSMGNNYVVYVDNITTPTKIMGFRNASNWYNSTGTEVSDPTVLESASGIQPYLVDPSNQVLNSSAFTDYVPQITYMPRVSFSFPISDEALFFAHYDVLTKRPTDATQLDPISYLFIEKAGTSVINNPNLKPEKTIDYEIGFQQKLNNVSSLKISAYYREMRDLVQSFRYYEAYPKTYISYNNIDFGTVKGFNITYDLRRTNNIWIKASYDLRFADGTGSSASESLGLVASGQPNLRTTHALSYDKRHEFKATVDYRYTEGTDYNGPVSTRVIKGKDGSETTKNIYWLQNTGVNFTFRGGSGLPYTARNLLDNTIRGAIDGSRLPWQFVIDARIDKDFKVKVKDKKSNKPKFIGGNVYVLIFNFLNTKNIMGVYPTTGNPNDNGYLSAAQNQNTIKAQVNETSFRELYALAINSPGNYMLPRRVQVGVQFDF